MLPLEGKTVLVTRPREQSSTFAQELEACGASVILLPAIEIAPPEDPGRLDYSLQNLESYDWVVLTSVNGVKAIEERLAALRISPDELSRKKLAVIGPATAQALSRFCREPDFMPDEFVSEAMASGLEDVRGKRFLLARADIARKNLAIELREAGALVDEVVAYCIVSSGQTPELEGPPPDYITLTSSSAVHGTLENLRRAGKEDWMQTAALACIGPITAKTVEDLGYRVGAMASEYTVPGLLKAILEHASGAVNV